MRKQATIMLESGILDVDVHSVEGNVATVYDRFGTPYLVDVADLEEDVHAQHLHAVECF